jgi:hypothetical protein
VFQTAALDGIGKDAGKSEHIALGTISPGVGTMPV